MKRNALSCTMKARNVTDENKCVKLYYESEECHRRKGMREVVL
jgi:hypothetical protein